jgi:hypothetical protein
MTFLCTAQVSHLVCQFCVSSCVWAICDCLLDSVAIMPIFCVPKFRHRSVRLNESRGRVSFFHFETLSALR